MKYIGVFYNYWMDTGYFERVEIKAESLEQAKKEAIVLCHEKKSTFNHVVVTVLEIDSDHSLRQHYQQRIESKIPKFIQRLFGV